MKSMRKICLTMLGLIVAWAAYACPVCGENQPKPLRGITHGAGSESRWDYVIIGVMAAIVLLTLFFSVKWLIRPGEKADNHIKRRILNLSADVR